MAIRPATVKDAELAAKLHQEFLETLGMPIQIEQSRIERRIQRWPTVQAVDDIAGVYCELKVFEDEKHAEFCAAFPRGASRGKIGPVFAECARLVLYHYSKEEQEDIKKWRVWGEFLHGQDEERLFDQGESICKAWVEYFAQFGLKVTARPALPIENSIWIAEMLLGDLASHGI